MWYNIIIYNMFLICRKVGFFFYRLAVKTGNTVIFSSFSLVAILSDTVSIISMISQHQLRADPKVKKFETIKLSPLFTNKEC